MAELVPPGQGRVTLVGDALLADAIRKGWLTPALDAPVQRVAHRPVADLATVLEEFDGDRDDR